MNLVIPCAVSLVTAAAFFALLHFVIKPENEKKSLPTLIIPTAIVLVYNLAATVIGFRLDTLTLSIAAFLFTAAGCWLLVFRKKKDTKRGLFLNRLSLIVLIAVALELSVFNYSAYSSPRKGELALPLGSAQVTTATLSGDTLQLDKKDQSTVTFKFDAADVRNLAVKFNNKAQETVTVQVKARDRNAATELKSMYTAQNVIVSDSAELYVPLSSKGMTELQLVFSGSAASVGGVRLNAPKPVRADILRLFVLILIAGVIAAIRIFGLYKAVYQPKHRVQRAVTVIAALLCIIAILMIAAAHVGDNYSNGSLLHTYDGNAAGKEPYYQLFDAFQKGQLNLDIPVDERLNEAGELAYDWGYRTQQGFSYAWDRAFYNGKYYSYYGTAPLFLFYYPVYFLTGKVPTTALTCGVFGALFVLFGFMLVFRIARTVVKESNYLLTLLCAVALPLTAGAFTLTAYGDFYNLPKLCSLAFLLWLYDLSIQGYERPRWSVFLLCGLCVGIIAASRPNALIIALALAPLYIGVLRRRDLSVKKKISCAGVFILTVGLFAVALMIYNKARFGSPLEFGAKYQLTVNNISMNNISLGFLGMAFFHYFVQPAQVTANFPFFSPDYVSLNTYTRYFYMMETTGVLAYPLNWALFSYPALRRKKELKPAYRLALVLTVVLTVVTALLDFALGGIAISYICDIAASVTVVAIVLLLLSERSLRGTGKVYKGAYIIMGGLLAATLVFGTFLLMGTSPYFIRESVPWFYGAMQGVFSF